MFTIRFIKSAGTKDVSTSEGVIRVPIYIGTAFRLTNLGMFEDVIFDVDYVYVPLEKLADFDGLEEPTAVPVYKLTFNRPPFPEQVLAGRPNNFTAFISIDEGERILGLFSQIEAEEG